MADIIEIVLLIFIAWFIVTQKSGRLADLFGKKQRIIVLDSCALIDGRVVELVGSKFIADALIIPQFILNELQLLADGNDSHKRERARFGLDIAHQLQDTPSAQVRIDRTVFTGTSTTDDKLLLLSKKLNAQLYTTDYNLSKVAAVEGITVLNVNELAQKLRPIALPGETLHIKIIQKGSNRDQGVGYLDDGTMIVVDGAVRFVGKIVPVTVTRMHQTVAGKMVFGQVAVNKQHSDERVQPQRDAAENRSDGGDSNTGAAITQKTRQPHAEMNAAHKQSRSAKLHSRFRRNAKRPVV